MARDTGIKSVADLAGKSVATPSITGNDWLPLLCWANEAGVQASSIRGVVAPAHQVSDLSQGRLDSALIFRRLLNQALKAGGLSLGDSYFGPPQFSSVWVARGSWALANHTSPSMVRAS